MLERPVGWTPTSSLIGVEKSHNAALQLFCWLPLDAADSGKMLEALVLRQN